MFLDLHYPLSWSNMVYNGRAKEVLLLHMSGDHGRDMSTRKEGRRSNMKINMKLPFLDIYEKKKSRTSSFGCMVTFLGSCSIYT